MDNLEYFIEQLAERTGLPHWVMQTLSYTVLTALFLAVMVWMKINNWI